MNSFIDSSVKESSIDPNISVKSFSYRTFFIKVSVKFLNNQIEDPLSLCKVETLKELSGHIFCDMILGNNNEFPQCLYIKDIQISMIMRANAAKILIVSQQLYDSILYS